MLKDMDWLVHIGITIAVYILASVAFGVFTNWQIIAGGIAAVIMPIREITQAEGRVGGLFPLKRMIADIHGIEAWPCIIVAIAMTVLAELIWGLT